MKQNCLKNCLSSKNGISFPYWPKDYLRIPTLFQLADFATPYNLLSSKKKERYVPVCVWYSLISSYSLLIFVLRFKSQTIKKKKVPITFDPQPVFIFGENFCSPFQVSDNQKEESTYNCWSTTRIQFWKTYLEGPYNLLSSKKKKKICTPVCVWYSLISSYSLIIFVLRFKSQTIKKKKVLITFDLQPVFIFGENFCSPFQVSDNQNEESTYNCWSTTRIQFWRSYLEGPYNLLSSKKKEKYVPVCVWYSLISSYSLLIFVLRFKSQTIKKKKVIKKIFIHNPYSILEKNFVLHFKSQTIRKKKVLITVDPQPVFNFGEHIWKERILFVYIKKNPPTHTLKNVTKYETHSKSSSTNSPLGNKQNELWNK